MPTCNLVWQSGLIYGQALTMPPLDVCGSTRPAHNNFSFRQNVYPQIFPFPKSPLSFFVPLLLRWPKLFLLFLGLSDPLLQCAILAALFHLTSDGLILIIIWPKAQIVQLQTKWDLMEQSTWIWIPDHLMVLINLKSWNLRPEGNRLWNPIYGGWCKTSPQPVNRTKIMRVRPI